MVTLLAIELTGKINITGNDTSSEREPIKTLEREMRELCRANDILRTARAFFAQAEQGRKRKQ